MKHALRVPLLRAARVEVESLLFLGELLVRDDGLQISTLGGPQIIPQRLLQALRDSVVVPVLEDDGVLDCSVPFLFASLRFLSQQRPQVLQILSEKSPLASPCSVAYEKIWALSCWF